jgi:putative effector of murein hydrolase
VTYALELGEVAAALSARAMGLNGAATGLLVPLLVRLAGGD